MLSSFKGRLVATAFGAALAAAALAQPAQAAEKVVVCALTFVSSSPLFIAADKGYYAEEGLEAEFKFFRAAQPVAVGIASGDCDFGVTAFTGGFFNLAGKGALKVIGAQSREEPGFDFVGFLASNQAYEAGLKSVEDLPGHSFGMTQVGSSFHYNIGLMADKFGWPDDAVALKPLQSVPNMIGAIKSGQVDSIALPAHIVAGLTGSGSAKLIGWVHDYTPWQLGGLFTSAKNVSERRPVVEAFVRAYQHAARDYHEAFNKLENGKRVFGSEAEALVPIIEKYTKAKPDAIYAGSPFIDPDGRLKVDQIYQQVAWMKKKGLVDESVDPKSFLDLSFISGHYGVPAN
ncbi:ABC transporter substrate-binding protein [Oceanibacterium hippocampi]|uniref:NMT1/THI5 like protein n=1 Tax=Oceanibacterium hippocampi TaxID=745714 RepID=A0A1Y5T4U8_9PROT|nr:ABC transporter substrate-binding protein [Oceanibacterium hippocampi]SLN55298.1 NMT1/THI5 like protein [Oceanibacterium hippocampi]